MRIRSAPVFRTRTVRLATLVAAVSIPLSAQDGDINLLDRWLIWSDSGTMVVRHLKDQVVAHLDHRAEAIARLHTTADWLARQLHVRATLERVIGTLPERNAALNPRITGVVQKEGYRIEKIVFESLPALHVTGCLLIPDGGAGHAPAKVVGVALNTWGLDNAAAGAAVAETARRTGLPCADLVRDGAELLFDALPPVGRR